MKEIITKKELPHNNERKKVNELLRYVFKSHMKAIKAAIEEDAVVPSFITFTTKHSGIDTTYYFSTKWGTVIAFIADSPEDCKVSFHKNKILALVDLNKKKTKKAISPL